MHRIVAAQRRAQQPDRVLGIATAPRPSSPGLWTNCTSLVWLCHGIAAFEEADRHAQHHRRGEAVVGAPAHRPAIVDLLGRRLGIFAELDFRHRHQPGERHADRAADNALLVEAGVEHALDVRTSPAARASRAWTPPFGPTSSPNTQHARIGVELLVERAADRGDHVDALRLRPCGSSVDGGAW